MWYYYKGCLILKMRVIIYEKLVGAAILGQSGGPTSVINASAAGVF